MTIETNIDMDDYKTFVSFIRKTNMKSFSLSFILWLIIGMIMGITLAIFYRVIDLCIHLPSFIGALVFFLIVSRGSSLIARKKFNPEKNGFILGRQTLQIGDDGIRVSKDHYESLTKWSGVRHVNDTDNHFFIMLDKLTGHIIPKRSFANDAQMQEFKDLINQKLSA